MTGRIVDVRLASMDVTWRTTWDFVTIETSDGLTGVGEWSDAASHVLARPSAETLARELIGRSVDDSLQLLESRLAGLSPHLSAQRRLQATVLGGFDAALCDLAARRDGVDLATWLGADLGEPAAIRLYANINRAVRRRTPEEFARQASAAVEAGFTVVKCAPFDFLVGARRVGDGLALARAARDAVGDDVPLLLDLHGMLEVEEILSVADDLVALRPGWVEDVAELDDLDGLRAVRDATGLPIAAGEFVAAESEILPQLEAGLVDVFMPDIKHAGGPRRALDLVRKAVGAGATVSPHNPCGPVATAHTAVLCSGLPDPLLEFAFGEWAGRAAVVQPDEPALRGRYTRPLGAGLGLGLDTKSASG